MKEELEKDQETWRGLSSRHCLTGFKEDWFLMITTSNERKFDWTGKESIIRQKAYPKVTKIVKVIAGVM